MVTVSLTGASKWGADGPPRTSGWRCWRRLLGSSARSSRGENVNHHGVHFDLEPSGNSCYRGTRDS